MAGSSGTWKLYDGDVELHFNQGSHVYEIETAALGTRKVPNVTAITGLLAKPALRYWFRNQALDAVSTFLDARVGEVLDEVMVRDCVADAKDAGIRTRDKAGDIGTIVHDWAEQWINAAINGAPPPSLPVSPKVAKACQSFAEWASTLEGEWMFAERKVFSRNNFYAGTVDAGFLYTAPAILDIKTGNSVGRYDKQVGDFVIYPEIRMQMAAYWAALVEENVWPAEADRVVLHIPVRGNGQAKAHYLDEDPDAYRADLAMFLGLRDVYRGLKGV